MSTLLQESVKTASSIKMVWDKKPQRICEAEHFRAVYPDMSGVAKAAEAALDQIPRCDPLLPAGHGRIGGRLG